MNKKILHLSLLWFLLVTSVADVFSQQPGINLEAIARDRNNNPAKDRRIYVRVDIIPGAAGNTPSFSEEHVTRTNEAGIFQISIGKGTRVGGSFNTISDIPWRMLNYLVKLRVAIEPVINVVNWNYQNEWVDIGTTPFGLVPYAGTALSAETVAGSAAVISFSGGSTGLTPASPSTGNVVLGGVLSIANGGTGSSTQNFVDLVNPQTVGGEKIFSRLINANEGLTARNILSLSGATTPLQLNGSFGDIGNVLISQGANATPIWMNLQQAAGIKSKNRSVLLVGAEVYEIPVSGLDSNDGISLVLEAGAAPVPIPSYYVIRDIPNSRVSVHFTAPFNGFVTWVIVD